MLHIPNKFTITFSPWGLRVLCLVRVLWDQVKPKHYLYHSETADSHKQEINNNNLCALFGRSVMRGSVALQFHTKSHLFWPGKTKFSPISLNLNHTLPHTHTHISSHTSIPHLLNSSLAQSCFNNAPGVLAWCVTVSNSSISFRLRLLLNLAPEDVYRSTQQARSSEHTAVIDGDSIPFITSCLYPWHGWPSSQGVQTKCLLDENSSYLCPHCIQVIQWVALRNTNIGMLSLRVCVRSRCRNKGYPALSRSIGLAFHWTSVIIWF